MDRKWSRYRTISSIAIFSLIVSACGSTAGNSASGSATSGAASASKTTTSNEIQLATATVGGSFQKFGLALAPMWQKALGTTVIATTSQGSKQNIVLVNSGKAQLALVSGHLLYDAWKGVGPFKKAYKNMDLVAYLSPTEPFFYTQKGSSLTYVSDLKGKRVGVGTSPGVFDGYSGPIFTSAGINYKTGIQKVYSGFSDLATQVGDGTLTAAINAQDIPAGYNLAAERGIKVLKFKQSTLNKLVKHYSFFRPATIPAKDMPAGWTGGPFKTVDWGGPYLIAEKSLPTNVVYNLTKAFATHLSGLQQADADFKWIVNDPKLMATPDQTMPFHPGAEKYWKQAGLWQGK